MNDKLLALRLFVRVARLGSFSAAARELDLSQPSVSRIIAALEQDVGAALVTRTTRAVTLTDAGEDYLTRVEAILASLDEADHVARGSLELRGALRVALSGSFGVREIIPLMPGFQARHPALRISLLMNDQRQDTLKEGVDVALRLGELADSSATARLIARTYRLIAASPTYLKANGTPTAPADLAAHMAIVGPAGTSAAGWSFQKDGKSLSIRVDSRLAVSVNDGAVAAAVAGMGIVTTTLWGCSAELAGGQLIQLLPDWTMGEVEVHGLFTPGRPPKPAARAFVEYLIAEFRRAGRPKR
ncbi:LysR substrate-binding domain-containing protein [Paucibacter sp. R3-3]|uniref:LysR substrate-binding domain-containing protein n=1 Tax=Roseateles agri TaxID=3098619 RepID=A0ABU5DRH7_9BURK|nr:LysR substrate-binding domain-containing protein [Paucibacter sp. R3-3]MDY0748927.1 LysR substrate-binding domain-containing protein [Paucibacter sp. R3-3]